MLVGGLLALIHPTKKEKRKRKRKTPQKYVDILVVQQNLKKSNMANPHLI
jgi:hypothetical protein